jgi:hypothetical protein
MSRGLSKVIDHLRADLGRNDKPQFEARFETRAKLLGGFVTVFRYCRARWVPHGLPAALLEDCMEQLSRRI